MAIIGTHALLYTTEPDAVREIFRDVFGWKNVDDGHGWLIFALPPAEIAMHPAEASGAFEFYLTCDDLEAEMCDLEAKGVACSDVEEARWGSITKITLPGGGEIGLYQPKHPLALVRTS